VKRAPPGKIKSRGTLRGGAENGKLFPAFFTQEKSKWFMDNKKSNEEKEARFSEIMQQPPYPVDEVLDLIADATGSKRDEWILAALQAFAEAEDFTARRYAKYKRLAAE
jgi:hypothetical protein